MNSISNKPSPNRFEAFDVSLDLIRELAVVMPRLRQRDADLMKQLRRAASSVALNLQEGSGRAGADRTHFFRIARGSTREVLGALKVAVAWGHLTAADTEPALQLADRVLAMTYRLCR